jgi:hypothetical protein
MAQVKTALALPPNPKRGHVFKDHRAVINGISLATLYRRTLVWHA